jgi:hypothetical protein
MKRYSVELSQTVVETAIVTVEAVNEAAAEDAALALADGGEVEIDWEYYRRADNDREVISVEPA